MALQNLSRNGNTVLYGGGQCAFPLNVVFLSSAPGSGYVDAGAGTLAIVQSTNAAYLCTTTTGTSATWLSLGGGTVEVNSLTGDSGGVISPTGGNINLLGGTGISTVGSGSTITFNAVGGGLKTTVSASTPTVLAPNTRLVTNTAGLYTATMPATANVGDIFEVMGTGAGGWLIQANTGQTINSSGGSTSVAGSLASTTQYDTVRFVCVVANTTFTVESINGVLTNA